MAELDLARVDVPLERIEDRQLGVLQPRYRAAFPSETRSPLPLFRLLTYDGIYRSDWY